MSGKDLNKIDEANKFFCNNYDEIDGVYISKENEKNYWSNLNSEENSLLVSYARELTASKAVSKYHPELYEVIFSPERGAGLELLDMTGDEICIDYGCMWGALSVPLAKRAKMVISVDQTINSLKLLQARLRDEEIENVLLVNDDVRKFEQLPNKLKANIAVVNGVLEWVPEQGIVELKKYYGKRLKKEYSDSEKPGDIQKNFLRNLFNNLDDEGKLYLAIENRYDFKMFFGIQDPHANLLFTTILPKSIANLVSRIKLKRPYVTWIYSKKELTKMLREVGFRETEVYCAFPDYRFPERIQSYSSSLKGFRPAFQKQNQEGKRSFRRSIAYYIEYIIFGVLRLKYLTPSFIIIAKK